MTSEATYLYERDDFAELVEGAAEFHAIQNPAIIEKDYYVTEALRLIGQRYGDQILFKGGTSLSKGSGKDSCKKPTLCRFRQTDRESGTPETVPAAPVSGWD